MENVKELIRSTVISCGAQGCGFAAMDRFESALPGHKPTDAYPDCKTVIAFFIALPAGLSKVEPQFIYNRFNALNADRADLTALRAAVEIEQKFGCFVVPVPTDGPVNEYDDEQLRARGILSMRHAAQAAGLGRIGKNNLFANKDYGTLVTIGAMMTDLELESDPMAEPLCLESCHKCIDNCPTKAIQPDQTVQLRCRPYTYGTGIRGYSIVNCNKCRVACVNALGERKKTLK